MTPCEPNEDGGAGQVRRNRHVTELCVDRGGHDGDQAPAASKLDII